VGWALLPALAKAITVETSNLEERRRSLRGDWDSLGLPARFSVPFLGDPAPSGSPA